MTSPDARATEVVPFNGRLALLLAMAMFVLVVDTSIMNVSIASVVADIGTTASGVQSTIALEALRARGFGVSGQFEPERGELAFRAGEVGVDVDRIAGRRAHEDHPVPLRHGKSDETE